MIQGFVIWTLAASLVTAAMYVLDKRAARLQRTRVSERSLLVASLLGGWPGGLVASRLIRHKTSKRSYRAKFIFAALVHVVVSGLLFFWLT